MTKKILIILVLATIAFAACNGGKEKNTEEVETPSSAVPDGYELVWSDDFGPDTNTSKTMPDTTKWWYETGGGGWGNNELQTYVKGIAEGDTLAYISDGTLKIKAVKLTTPIDNHKYASIRINSKASWKYGYIEARLKTVKGYGTWPAFWMLPEDFKNWPIDGEIDIMEHAGNVPDSIHITVHTQKHNHSNNTQISSISYVPGSQNKFHTYGIEWNENYIKGYIDGQCKYTFENDGRNDKETWPFDKPFYLKLNLALGGFFSNQVTVDEAALPAIYEIDYVKVYQKKQ